VPVFVRSVLIDAPVADVFRFHEREDALQLLTPSFPPIRLVKKTGKGIEKGARVELSIAGVPWIALHTAYQRNKLFEDKQIQGPMAKWVHRHEFAAEGSKTRLTDRVEYELPGGPLVNALFGWTVKLGLGNMFAHRHSVTRKLCEKQ
jgi:ligand-binding SRPBCC domain-containing protein